MSLNLVGLHLKRRVTTENKSVPLLGTVITDSPLGPVWRAGRRGRTFGRITIIQSSWASD